jgi:hypothetical protein
MVPQLERVASRYSVPVACSGGFDSTTAKHSMGQRLAGLGAATVLHVGDHDPSGVHMFGSLDEDVTAFCDYYGGDIEFIRLAVTPEQVEEHQHPTAPPKATDNRSFSGLTTQAEALDPAVLADIVRQAIEQRLDMEAYHQRLDEEVDTRETLKSRLTEIFSRA